MCLFELIGVELSWFEWIWLRLSCISKVQLLYENRIICGNALMLNSTPDSYPIPVPLKNCAQFHSTHRNSTQHCFFWWGLARGGCSILWGLQLHLWTEFRRSIRPFETSMLSKSQNKPKNMFPGYISGNKHIPWNNPKRKLVILVFKPPFSEVLVPGSVAIQGHLLRAAEQALTAALYAIELTCIWCPVAEANNCRAQGHFLSWSDSLTVK